MAPRGNSSLFFSPFSLGILWLWAAIEIGNGRTFEDPNSGGEVVDSSCRSQSCGDDRWGGDEIVGEAIVKVALWFKEQTSARRLLSRAHWILYRSRTCSSKTSCTASNSFSYLCCRGNIPVSRLPAPRKITRCALACFFPLLWAQCIESGERTLH